MAKTPTRPDDPIPRPIADKAEVSIDFPEKTYMGSFGRDARFEVSAGPDEAALKLVRRGENKREVQFHVHYYLLADILRELAAAVGSQDIDAAHRQSLGAAAAALHEALRPPRKR